MLKNTLFKLFDFILDDIQSQVSGNNKQSDEFIKQVSFVLLSKLILIKILEDNHFIDRNLYNGGFKKLSEPPFHYTLLQILKNHNIQVQHFDPYFCSFTIYDFDIQDKSILSELSGFNFAEVNFDLIGDLYEHYLNIDARKEKGQYYTPHYIVEFILNRLGFTGKNKKEIDSRTLWDPSAGSGGFIIEAARRLRIAGINKPGESKRYIINNLYATELTSFATFLCELNTVIQIIPLIHKIKDTEAKSSMSKLNILKQDSLLCFEEHKNDFDFVAGNPPYVGESGHKDLFRPLQNHPYWKKYYMGKSDYLYYFIILGLSKLKEGGRLSFITTQYWITADGAKNLRKYILENSKILEITDFKGIKLFPEAKGQENIVFVLEKCEDKTERMNHKIKIVHFKKEWVLDSTEYILSNRETTSNFEVWTNLLTNKEQFDLFANPDKSDFYLDKYKRDEIADVYYSAILQGELTEDAWYIYKKDKDAVFDYPNDLVPLDNFCNVNQGVVPGPLNTSKIFRKLSIEVINKYKITEREGVFVLSQQEVLSKSIEEDIIKPFHKNSDIKKCYLNFNSDSFLIYTPDVENLEKYPFFRSHIQKYKDYLITRREVVEDKIRWFDLWWSREKSLFQNEKIMISYRTTTNNFAYTNFPFYSATDTYYINAKEETTLNLKYFFGILISKKILDWLKNGNCKIKGESLELFTTSVSKIPIKAIDFDKPKELSIYKLISGNYSTTEKEGYRYNSTSNTWIKEYGLVDHYMDLMKELYDLTNVGFSFQLDNPLKNKNELDKKCQSIYDSLKSISENDRKNIAYIVKSQVTPPKVVKNVFFIQALIDELVEELYRKG